MAFEVIYKHVTGFVSSPEKGSSSRIKSGLWINALTMTAMLLLSLLIA